MSRRFSPKVVTANALVEGHVVYLAEDDRWVRNHREAEVLEVEAHAQLRLLEAKGRNSEVVDAYLADTIIGSDGPEPVHFREVFRARGVSNYHLDKQVRRAPATEPGPRPTR